MRSRVRNLNGIFVFFLCNVSLAVVVVVVVIVFFFFIIWLLLFGTLI